MLTNLPLGPLCPLSPLKPNGPRSPFSPISPIWPFGGKKEGCMIGNAPLIKCKHSSMFCTQALRSLSDYIK